MADRMKTVGIIRKGISVLWLVLFVFVYILLALANTMLPLSTFFSFYLNAAFSVLILCCIIGVALDYLTARENGHLYLLIFKLAVLLTAYYFFNYSAKGINDIKIWFLILFAITSNNQKEDRLLKIGLSIGTAVVILAFFLSMLGIVENNRGNSFGFTYRTHYACFLLCMMLAYAILKDGWFTWVGELGLIALDTYVLWLGAKTAFICLAVLTLGIFCRHYRRNGGTPFQDRKNYGFVISSFFQLVYLPTAAFVHIAEMLRLAKLKNAVLHVMRYSFILCGALSVFAAITYRTFLPFWNHVPGLSTFKDRLLYGLIGLNEFPITLFGNRISQIGASGFEMHQSLYFAFDCAYVKILLQYGLVIFVLMIGLLTLAQFRLYKKRRYFAMFVMTIFAIDNIMEYQMINLTYDLFVLLPFCLLSEKPGIEACDRLNLERLSTGKRWLLGLGIAAVCAVLGLWTVTAYQITNWRGWTPDYGATIVVADKSNHALDWTRYYMNFHPDAVCVVPSDKAQDWLVSQGINADRLWVQSNTGVDDMLTGAYTLIGENNLPKRLTVCTADILQGRIVRRAEALHIPVNSLSYKLHGMELLRTFAAEQWRMLWEK